MNQSLLTQFADAAAAAHDAFPAQLARLFVVGRTVEAPVYVSPEIAELLSQNVAAVKDVIRDAADQLYRQNAGGFAARARTLANQPVKMIAIDDQPSGVFDGGYSRDVRAIYILDHELGHYVVKSGMAGGHRGEAAADAFAALRHIQRYGMDDPFFQYTNRALPMVLAQSPAHYTVAVMQRVQDVARTRDITRMSLADTAMLAEEIAESAAFDAQRLSRLGAAFTQAGDAYLAAYGSKQAVKEKLNARDPAAFTLFVTETLKIKNGTTEPDVQAAIAEFFEYPPLKNFVASNPQLLNSSLKK